MTTKEAYEIIVKATGAVLLDRANHKIMEEALAVIGAIVSAPEGK